MKQHITDRITSTYGELSPQEQRAADVVLEHLDDLAAYTSAELAEKAGVSRATFSRFYRHLGFESSHEVKELARVRRSQGIPVVVDGQGPQTSGHTGAKLHVAEEIRKLTVLFTPENLGRIDDLALGLTRARRVLVLGWRNSYPVALHLRTQLQQVRQDVRLAPLPGQTVGEELLDMGAQDLVIAIGCRRRPRGFQALLEGCAAAQIPVALIADPSARHLAGQVRHWVECPIDRSGAFDSYAAPFSLVAWLADAVLRNGDDRASQRVDQATEFFEDLEELALG